MVGASRHAGTSLRITDRSALFVLVMDNAYKVPEVAIMLNDLMCDPFTLLYGLWSSRQCHEVAFDDVLGVGIIQPDGLGAGKVVEGESVTAGKASS